ncbi:hypothetical protein [uncultured Acinetobacter sp.]|uniref:hypothetical protein n=1 Tax=uncultured Acinetobacter sp. TaxID=165433 RepID=UPI0025DD8754|nr:hypothetical protein [uncultured Acinetobacter sp.]
MTNNDQKVNADLMDKCREAFEKNRFWIGVFKADVVFKSEIGEFGLYEALNSKVEAEYLVEFNNKWVIWYQCWKYLQADIDEYKMVSESIEDLYLLERKKVKAVEQVLIDLKESMTNFKEMDLYDKGVRVVTDYIIRDLEKALRGAQ